MGLLGNFGTSLTLLLAHLSLFRAHREHKVHNIVLYPDKESWCKTTPIKQVVTWPSCSSQELDNNVCVGACFSYMVPHSEPSAPGDLIRPYCDSCQPLDSIWHTVTLDCKDKDDNPTTMQKKVQIITNCSCSSCMESSRIKPDLNSLLQSLELESARMAGGHHLGQPHHHHGQQPAGPGPGPAAPAPTQPEAPPQQQSQDASQLDDAGLSAAPGSAPAEPGVAAAPGSGGAAEAPAATAPLAQQQSPSSSGSGAAGSGGTTASAAAGNQSEQVAAPVPEAPRHETPDLLLNPNLNGSGKAVPIGAKAHERFFQLFKQLNDPSLADDKFEKLSSFEKLEKLKKLEYAGAKEVLANLSELLHKYSSQDEQSGGEGGLGDEDEAGVSEEQILQLLPSSTSSAPPPAIPELKKDDDDEEVPSLQDQQLRVAASILKRTGPHHSLVLDSGVKEKIDVESHYLHPALAGQEISYHDNVLHDKTDKKDF